MKTCLNVNENITEQLSEELHAPPLHPNAFTYLCHFCHVFICVVYCIFLAVLLKAVLVSNGQQEFLHVQLKVLDVIKSLIWTISRSSECFLGDFVPF